MSTLSKPRVVVEYLRAASRQLSTAHRWAGEEEDGCLNLTGSVRDLIFGLTTALDALVQAVEDGRFGPEEHQ